MLEGVSNFFSQRGINPAAGIAFLVLLVAAALLVVFVHPQPPQFRTVVLSSGGTALDNASVQIYTTQGQLLAQGTTSSDGSALFTQSSLPKGAVVVKVTASGFVASDGSGTSVQVVDLSQKTTLSVQLYSSAVAPGQFNGSVTFSVLDSTTQQPIAGASLDALVGSQGYSLKTDSAGSARVLASQGQSIRVKVSASGYFSDSRSFTAIRGAETILLSPSTSQGVSFSTGSLPQQNSPGQIGVSNSTLQDNSPVTPVPSLSQINVFAYDSQGNALQSGAVSVVSSSGQTVASAEISSGFATLSQVTLSNDFWLLVQGDDSGKVAVYDALSNALLFTRFLDSGRAPLGLAPFGLLTVEVNTSDGDPVDGGNVRAYDSNTGSLLDTQPLSQGLSSFQGFDAGENVTLTLDTIGYPAASVQTVFGQADIAYITAIAVSSNQTFSTFSASGENGAISAHVQAYSPGNAIPAFDSLVQGSQQGALLPGTYSAVFSSPGRYSYTFPSFHAGDELDAILPLSGTTVTESECTVVNSSKSCVQASFSPASVYTLSGFALDQTGAPAGSGVLLSVKDSSNRVLGSMRSQDDSSFSFPGLGPGPYTLWASLGRSTNSTSVTLSSDTQLNLSLSLTATLLLSAASFSSDSISANFSTDSGLSCTGRSCQLSVPAGQPVQIFASAQGYRTASASRTPSAGDVLPVSFILASSSSSSSVSFLGAHDTLGRAVSSLAAGQDYFLQFALSGTASTETDFVLRLGDRVRVEDESAGILDFTPDNSFFASKSTSFSPQPTCIDLNNNNPAGGLFKWAELSFANSGAPIQKTLSIPIHVRANATDPSITIFYRLDSVSGTSHSRTPADSGLGSASDSADKAGCYADSNSLSIAIAFGNSCRDGTPQGQCSTSAPYLCTKDTTGAYTLQPDAQCCPEGTTLSNGLCVVPSPSSGNCADNTAPSQCSSINVPKACINGTLSSSVSCCPPSTVFDSGLCRPPGASCQIGATVYRDGACLPTAPGRCLNGEETSDPLACGCPQGQALSGNSCAPAFCSDGTPLGACSHSTPLEKCSLSSDGSVALTASPSCSCPSGTTDSNGQCVSCATLDCGAALTCKFNSANYSTGCILSSVPLYCNPDGSLSQNPTACGCAQGKQFDPTTGACLTPFSPACTDGTSASSCASNPPQYCALLGGRPLLIDNALSCGCGSGLISDGVSCRAPTSPQNQQQVVQPPGNCGCPTAFAPVCASNGLSYANSCEAQCANSTVASQGVCSPVPIAPAVQTCSVRNACLSPDNSSDYCNAQGIVQQSCLVCDRTCGGNSLLTCSSTTNSCQPLKCSFPLPGGTPVEQCVSGNAPQRCSLDTNGNALLSNNALLCGCPSGFKPDSNGQDCVACTNANCAGEVSSACTAFDGTTYSAGQCLPDSYSNTTIDAAEPIKQCQAGGSILDNITACGCPTGFQRNSKNTACVPTVTPSGPASLPAGASCANCVANDTVFFNSADGKLETVSGQVSYTMQADPIYPADAFRIFINKNSLPFPLSVQQISSPDGTSPCYNYDPSTSIFSFKLNNACPLEVRGNSFYHTTLGQDVPSDSVTLTLLMASVPPALLNLSITVNFVQADSLVVTPLQLQGPSTPQLIYIVNNKQTSFGPRDLTLQASSSATNEIPGAGVKVLAWRGPGGLSISEKTEPIATLNYQTTASYFLCNGQIGTQISSCSGDAFCCAGGWCTGGAFLQMFSDFRNYARTTAAQTAFRRGNGEPYNTISGTAQPFALYTVAGLVDGSQGILSGAGLSTGTFETCGNFSQPGVYSIAASTTNGNTFSYSSNVASLQQFDYVDGTCTSNSNFVSDPSLARPDIKAQPLCNFLYGDCSCVQSSAHSILPTSVQNAEDNSWINALPFMMMMAPLLGEMAKLAALAKGSKGGGGGGGGGRGGKNPRNNNNNGGNTQAIPSHQVSVFIGSKNTADIANGGAAPHYLGYSPNIMLTTAQDHPKNAGGGGTSNVASNNPNSGSTPPPSGSGGSAPSTVTPAPTQIAQSTPTPAKTAPLESVLEFQTASSSPSTFGSDPTDGCTDLSQKYVDKRKQTQQLCGGPEAFSTDIQRTGPVANWIADSIATGANPEINSAHGFPDGTLQKVPFDMTNLVQKNSEGKPLWENDDQILTDIDRCEDAPHSSKDASTLYNYCWTATAPDYDTTLSLPAGGIKNDISTIYDKLSTSITVTDGACRVVCTTDYPPLFGDPIRRAACYAGCDDFASHAKEDLKTLGDPTALAEGKLSDPSTPATSCAEAAYQELKAGDACETANKNLAGADGIKGLLVDQYNVVLQNGKTITRTSANFCYAYGTKGGGQCVSACRPRDAFVEVLQTAQNKLQGVAHYGIDAQCKPIQPELEKEGANNVFKMSVNDFMKFLASRGYNVQAPTPPTGSAGKSTPTQKTVKKSNLAPVAQTIGFSSDTPFYSPLKTIYFGGQITMTVCQSCLAGDPSTQSWFNSFLSQVPSSYLGGQSISQIQNSFTSSGSFANQNGLSINAGQQGQMSANINGQTYDILHGGLNAAVVAAGSQASGGQAGSGQGNTPSKKFDNPFDRPNSQLPWAAGQGSGILAILDIASADKVSPPAVDPSLESTVPDKAPGYDMELFLDDLKGDLKTQTSKLAQELVDDQAKADGNANKEVQPIIDAYKAARQTQIKPPTPAKQASDATNKDVNGQNPVPSGQGINQADLSQFQNTPFLVPQDRLQQAIDSTWQGVQKKQYDLMNTPYGNLAPAKLQGATYDSIASLFAASPDGNAYYQGSGGGAFQQATSTDQMTGAIKSYLNYYYKH